MKKSAWLRFLFRFSRMGAIAFILFISMFALDIFGQGYTFRQTVVGLFMHLIPTWIMIIALILSRKRYPLVGTIAFGGFGLRYTVTSFIRFFMSVGGAEGPAYYYLIRPLTIAVPPLLVGLAFLLHRLAMRKNKRI